MAQLRSTTNAPVVINDIEVTRTPIEFSDHILNSKAVKDAIARGEIEMIGTPKNTDTDQQDLTEGALVKFHNINIDELTLNRIPFKSIEGPLLDDAGLYFVPSGADQLQVFGFGDGTTKNFQLKTEKDIVTRPPIDSTKIRISTPWNTAYLYNEPRTNYVHDGNDFSTENWTLEATGAGITPVVTPNFAAGPDGVVGSASRIQFNDGDTAGSISCISQVLSDLPMIDQNYVSLFMRLNTDDAFAQHKFIVLENNSDTKICELSFAWGKFEDFAINDNTAPFRIGLLYDSLTEFNQDYVSPTLDILICYVMVGLKPTAQFIEGTHTDYEHLADGMVRIDPAPASDATLEWSWSNETPGIHVGTPIIINNKQIIGTRQPAVYDAFSNTLLTQFNQLLSRLRAHGLIEPDDHDPNM